MNGDCWHYRFIGGLYGRTVGYAMVDWWGVHVDANSYWAWMDPGAFALVGAASFFGGVSRLTMSLTVIMVSHHHRPWSRHARVRATHHHVTLFSRWRLMTHHVAHHHDVCSVVYQYV